jgi:spermidine synthase
VSFDDDIIIPSLTHNGDTWMSYTPSEFFTLRTALPHATGRVLVAGLGLGYQLRMLAAKKAVKSIVVVENDRTIAEWLSRHLPPEVRSKLEEVVHADAYEYTQGWMQNYDSILWDIWRSYGRARNDYRWNKIRKKASDAGKKTWAWGQSGPPRTNS